MASEVLQKTRRINKTLQTSSGSKVSFDKLAETVGEVLDANVYVLNTKGKVLGLYLTDIQYSSVIIDVDTKQKNAAHVLHSFCFIKPAKKSDHFS